jgi:uncharacterized protein
MLPAQFVAARSLALARSHHREGAPVTSRQNPLVLNAAELLRQPGSHRRVEVDVSRGELGLADARLTGDVTVDVDVESTLDDVIVTGRLTTSWRDQCSRCLRPLSGVLEMGVDERYAVDPGADDAYPIVRGQLDLAPMLREEVLLAMPDAPLCRPDCPGLCPTCGADLAEGPCGCETTVGDERWAVLDQLRDELSS